MGMGDGDGQCVRGVIGLRYAFEAQEDLGHLLHLHLARPTVAGHRLLDGQRRVVDRLDAALGGGQHDDAAGVPDREGGLHVDVDEQFLDGDGVRLEPRDQRAELIVDAAQTRAVGVLGRRDDAAMTE